ncbi:hypothetical protein [uncultured Clostridium sp.]|jgi:hypothetical protein|uniref:hypothetical protein n=1 Tax=uncultured Clostridium sp. TaxID=59620 RepID=UPI002614DB57|nr:hypothetical protein [uncultured Clostridium sp.]
MRVITENILCLDRPYINLKRLSTETAIRKGSIDEKGLKTTYIIDQTTKNLFKNENYTVEVNKGIEKQTYNTATLNNTLLVDVNYVSRTGPSSAKLKVFAIIDGIKYALPYGQFEDIYDGCFEILAKNLGDDEELTYINYGFKNLEKEIITVDIKINLERLADFKDVVDYKRNIDFFVLNNTLASISKFDIKNKKNKIEVTDKITVLRYQFSDRLYEILKPTEGKTVNLAETDIICDLTDIDFPIVNMYTSYGLAKLVDIKNNVIPTTKNTNLFANILDLGLPVLR